MRREAGDLFHDKAMLTHAIAIQGPTQRLLRSQRHRIRLGLRPQRLRLHPRAFHGLRHPQLATLPEASLRVSFGFPPPTTTTSFPQPQSNHGKLNKKNPPRKLTSTQSALKPGGYFEVVDLKTPPRLRRQLHPQPLLRHGILPAPDRRRGESRSQRRKRERGARAAHRSRLPRSAHPPRDV